MDRPHDRDRGRAGREPRRQRHGRGDDRRRTRRSSSRPSCPTPRRASPPTSTRSSRSTTTTRPAPARGRCARAIRCASARATTPPRATSAASTATSARAPRSTSARSGLQDQHRPLDEAGHGQTAEELYPGIGNLTKSDARAIGVLVVLNDVRASAEAWVDRTDLQSRHDRDRRDREGAAAGRGRRAPSRPPAARSTAPARCSPSTASWPPTSCCRTPRPRPTTASLDGAVAVSATNNAGIDATRRGGDARPATPASASRWRSTRSAGSRRTCSSTLVDALLGDPLIAGAFKGEQPAEATAIVRNSTVKGTSLAISADNAAQLNATISNAADSTARRCSRRPARRSAACSPPTRSRAPRRRAWRARPRARSPARCRRRRRRRRRFANV